MDGHTPAPRVHLSDAPKPRLRGRLHQAAFLVAVPAGFALVASASTLRARVATAIFALSLAGLYGTSTAYHRLPWSPRAHRWMKRLDHSMIFVLIAGTYTPVALLVLRGRWSVAILSIVWGGAAIGVLLKMIHIDGLSAVGAALYIALGWLVVVAAPELVRGVNGVSIGLLLAGGLLYTTGSIVLATHRPDPSPRVFGYHEVFHSLVICGSVCHFVFVLLLL